MLVKHKMDSNAPGYVAAHDMAHMILNKAS